MNQLPVLEKEQLFFVTPSLMLEYLYCPRFIYFMEVLHIPQNEEVRYKVQQGREIHQKKALQNKEYLRARIGVVEKRIGQHLYSVLLGIQGVVDEVLLLRDGTAAPLDYKFAVYKERIYVGYRTQLTMYAALIRDNLKIEVDRGYLVYTRSRNRIIEIPITAKSMEIMLRNVEEILEVIYGSKFPKATKTKSKCWDCCYRNMCIK